MRTLRDFAHARAGDKGDTSNISVIAYEEADYALLERFVTAAAVKAHLGDLVAGAVYRYELPRLAAFNFVLERALAGGVTRSLALDAHGKGLSFTLLSMEIPDVEEVGHA